MPFITEQFIMLGHVLAFDCAIQSDRFILSKSTLRINAKKKKRNERVSKRESEGDCVCVQTKMNEYLEPHQKQSYIEYNLCNQNEASLWSCIQ